MDAPARVYASGGVSAYTPLVAEFIGLVFSLVLLIFALSPSSPFCGWACSRELEALAGRVERLRAGLRNLQSTPRRGHRSQRIRRPQRTRHAPQSVEPATAVRTATVVAPPPDASGPLPEQPPLTDPAVPPVIPVAPSPTPSIAAASAVRHPKISKAASAAAACSTLASSSCSLGVSFFLKYAFDNEWIDESGRVVLGALSALALDRRRAALAVAWLTAFGQALTGTGSRFSIWRSTRR